MSGDFRNASTAEVRDAQGKVLLRGTFATGAGDQDAVERQAALTATADGGQATGDAEIEYSKAEPNMQEIEFEVSGVPARAIVTLVLDGRDVISATATTRAARKPKSTSPARKGRPNEKGPPSSFCRRVRGRHRVQRKSRHGLPQQQRAKRRQLT